jgi:hypothetical protein
MMESTEVRAASRNAAAAGETPAVPMARLFSVRA